ncbi:MAG: molybdenum cofactor biosynthesis protein B [Myxococcales bacterium]|nr:molybdenum cofactor biosynthesis protein B [Myxococcales bacterium]
MTEFIPVPIAVLTVSDTRTLDTDRSGQLIVDRLTAAGHVIAHRAIVTDDIAKVRAAVAAQVADPGVDVVICTGGTGVTRRDITPEAIAPLASKPVPGFGELFRWLSYADIGASTIQSRADAWVCDGTLVFALPGSTGAVTLAMDKILLQQLDRRTKPCNFVQLLPRIKAEAPPA